MHEQELLSYKDLSKILNRSVITLRHDVMLNRIPHLKLGNGKTAQVRFRQADIESWLDSKSIPAKGGRK